MNRWKRILGLVVGSMLLAPISWALVTFCQVIPPTGIGIPNNTLNLQQGNVGVQIRLNIQGKPIASQLSPRSISRTVFLPAGAQITCFAAVGASASAPVLIQKLTGSTVTTLTTVTFANNSGAANEACSYVAIAAQISFVSGDTIWAKWPASADATLSDVSISLPMLE